MTDYNDNSTLKLDPVSNMAALKKAINSGDEERLKALLTNILFDELQKSYLINLAQHRDNSEIIRLLKDAPATP